MCFQNTFWNTEAQYYAVVHGCHILPTYLYRRVQFKKKENKKTVFHLNEQFEHFCLS